MTNKAME